MSLSDSSPLPRIPRVQAFPTSIAPTEDWSDIEALLQSPTEENTPGRTQMSAGALRPRWRHRSFIMFVASPAAISLVFASMLTCALWRPALPITMADRQVVALSPSRGLADANTNSAPIVEGRSSSKSEAASRMVDASAATVDQSDALHHTADARLRAIQDLDLRLHRLQAASDLQATEIKLTKQRLDALVSQLH